MAAQNPGKYIVPPTAPGTIFVTAGDGTNSIRATKGCVNSPDAGGGPVPDEVVLGVNGTLVTLPITSVDESPFGASVKAAGTYNGWQMDATVHVSVTDAVNHTGNADFVVTATKGAQKAVRSSGSLYAGQVYINPA